eukprot:878610_1
MAKARKQIVSHILDETMNTFQSYHFYSLILLSITITQYSLPDIHQLWNQQVSNLKQDHKMINVFRLQLLYIIYENVSLADVSTIYHVVQACFTDTKFSFKRMRTPDRINVATAIYNSFIRSVKSLFTMDRTHHVSPKDYVLLYSIYNFFHYFGNSSSALPFHNAHKNDQYFTSHDSWSTLPLQELLELDLAIASLDKCRRKYPLERLLIRLCSIKRDIPLFRNCLLAVSRSKDT